jgi:hypothetical protein
MKVAYPNTSVSKELLLSLPFEDVSGSNHNETCVCGLHRLPYHPYQVVTQSVQICLISQLGGEGFESLGCIVLPSVEAPIYEGLDAPPQWVEQCSYQESGDDYGE